MKKLILLFITAIFVSLSLSAQFRPVMAGITKNSDSIAAINSLKCIKADNLSAVEFQFKYDTAITSLWHVHPEYALKSEIGDAGGLFAYTSTLTNTVIATALEWNVYQSLWTIDWSYNFKIDTTGITYLGETRLFSLMWMSGGVSDKNCDIKIAMVKNGVFTANVLTTGSILSGSGGKDYSDQVATSAGEVNPRCFWAGYLSKGDKLTTVITSTVDATTYTPDGASGLINTIR